MMLNIKPLFKATLCEFASLIVLCFISLISRLYNYMRVFAQAVGNFECFTELMQITWFCLREIERE